MKLPLAQKIAEKIVTELSPLCHQITVAGSIRRERPNVNDIDIVAIPKDYNALRARIALNCTIEKEGDQIITARLANKEQLDVFIAYPTTSDLFTTKPTNWGSVLLCRTGSKEHNIKLAEKARSMGLRWKVTQGIFRGETLLASVTEEAIFTALDLPFVAPKDREFLSLEVPRDNERRGGGCQIIRDADGRAMGFVCSRGR